MSSRDDGIVYSTQHGKMCPRCNRPIAGCVCARMQEAARAAEGDGIVRVGRETKGRKGGGVTVIRGLRLGDKDLRSLAKQLKKRCGSGGTVRDGVIEIQGDHRDVLVDALAARGWTVKKAGG